MRNDVAETRRDTPPTAELEVLLAVYESVTAEMNRRHGERYQFHSLGFLLLGAVAALISVESSYVSDAVKAWVFAVAPIPFATIMGLMLKEHQYINMRDRYLETELRPRIAEVAAPSSGKFPWLGWEEFEHLQMGRKRGLPRARQRFVVFAILDLLDYAIPSVLVVVSLVSYLALRDHAPASRWADVIAGAGMIAFVLMCALVMWLRTVEQRWYPRRHGKD